MDLLDGFFEIALVLKELLLSGEKIDLLTHTKHDLKNFFSPLIPTLPNLENE